MRRLRGASASIVTCALLLLASFLRAQDTPPAAPVAVAPARPGQQTIVIDPGHGGDDRGALGSSGVEEKALALGLAQRVRATIETQLGLRVILTREEDRAMSADERAALANNSQALLFLSLHANTAPSRRVAGAEVLHLRLEQEGANVEGAVDEAAVWLPMPGGGRPLDLLPWNLAHARHVDASARLAAMLEEALRARVTMGPRPVQQASLRALVSVNMPAALVEIGYLTNAEQEVTVQSEAYQELVAQAISEAVGRFQNDVNATTP
jgi:N-acetylmuramoyl-L-alanine amidase